MPEEQVHHNRSRLIAATAAGALVGVLGTQVVGATNSNLTPGFNFLRGDDCAYDGDSIGAEVRVAQLMTDAIGQKQLSKTSPTDIAVRPIGTENEAYRNYISFKERAVKLTGEAAVHIAINATYQQIKPHVSEVLHEYGVSLDDRGLASNPQELNTLAIKKSLLNISDFMTKFPVETIRKFGLKEIVVTNQLGKPDKNGDIVGEVKSNNKGVIYLALPKLRGYIFSDTADVASVHYILGHELYHVLDTSMCRGDGKAHITNDSDFAVLNGGHTYDTHKVERTYFISKNTSAAFTDQMKQAFAGDVSGSCNVLDKATADTVFNRSYARTNVAEDKAETGLNVFFPEQYARILAMKKSVFREKFVKLMSRLYAYDPASAEFLIDTAAKISAGTEVQRCIS